MNASALPFVFDDGGRALAGRKGHVGDCVARAIAIATQTPYLDVIALINARAGKAIAQKGVPKSLTRRILLEDFGWQWTPTMAIGQGCVVHLRQNEVPMAGRLVVSVTRHVTAVIDGVVHDTHDPARGGSRCVYGFYSKK